ncbi:hypothetical protein PHYBOEH_006137 [Phytophthora boehmeriae]|uniref:Transmembrane protein n=1 Tax=Phytophthora boehmeriae TaxID=109152 RepID=A0A8T1WLL7_9STRA|nr:hypothetical protein PHYBOEH_006137 [Phytophthora boehmeriae]
MLYASIRRMLCQSRRRASDYRKKRVSRSSRGFVVFFGVLGAAIVLGEALLPVLSFLQSYPMLFVAFYKPKVLAFVTFMQQTVDEMDVSEQVSEAWDFTVAFVTVTSVYHIVESVRKAAAGRLSSSIGTNASQAIDDELN